MEELEKTTVWYSIQNGGDGSVYPYWFLSKQSAEEDQESLDEGWGEPCIGSVETFVGSNVHKKAMKNV